MVYPILPYYYYLLAPFQNQSSSEITGSLLIRKQPKGESAFQMVRVASPELCSNSSPSPWKGHRRPIQGQVGSKISAKVCKC